MPRKTTENEADRTAMLSPNKLELLFTIINKEKTEFFQDLLQGFEINMQMILSAHGTAASATLEMLGLGESEKSVIISVVKKSKVKEALEALKEKFTSVKGGKGIAYTVPMSSTIGVAIYQFLSNTSSGGGII